MEAGEAQPRGRVAIALGAALLLGVIVTVVLHAASGEDEERAALAPDAGCVESWNSDRAATAYGRHNFNFHDYEGALVTFLDPLGEEVGADAERALCAVIFPSQVLDAEPFAAGQVLRGRFWEPISLLAGVEETRVAELQVTAAGAPNATLERTGRLGAL